MIPEISVTRARVLFVQYGDYKQTYERFARGEGETYYAQRQTDTFIAQLTETNERVGVICVNSDGYEVAALSNGVYVAGLRAAIDQTGLLHLINRFGPTHLIVRTPMISVIDNALRHRQRIFPLLADSFEQRGLRNRWFHFRLRRLLNRPEIPWVGNHGSMASRSLMKIGVAAAKILPYDVAPPARPADFAPREPPEANSRLALLYASALTVDKGVTDAIEAIDILRRRGVSAALTILGADDCHGTVGTLVDQRGLSDYVTLRGRVSHAQVLREMREHHAVLLPSRHRYPEGIPYVVYDSFCTRTPLIASDHPMFIDNISDGHTGLICREADPESLANACSRLFSDPELYRRLSHAGETAWHNLMMPVDWCDAILRFLDGPQKHADWLKQHCLATRMTAIQRNNDATRGLSCQRMLNPCEDFKHGA